MRIFVLVFCFINLFCFNSGAELYVCLDKSTNEPKGMIDTSQKTEWEKSFILIEADESYRGKAGYEMKYDGKLRHATAEEIAAYKQAEEQAQEANKKAKALEILGLTTKDIEKIKKLPNEVVP